MAEFGCNWDNREQAYFMMGEAKALGINLIKFQLFTKEQVPKKLEHMVIEEEFARELVETGRQYKQDIFFTPMYPAAVDMCERIGVKYYKIRYIDNKNLIIYRKIKKTKVPVFISCTSPKETIYWNMSKFQKRMKFLYCVPLYPAKRESYTINNRGKPIPIFFGGGISDHTPDLELFQICNQNEYRNRFDYFEMHIAFDEASHERKWSKTFEELKEIVGVLK